VSENAIAHVAKWAQELGVPIETRVTSSVDDVYDAGAFDVCISVNVLYHNPREEVFRSMGLIRRWLRPGGLFYFTCASREDASFNPGREIAPHTYELEPGHVHYLADKTDLEEALYGFRIERLHRCEHHWDGGISSRWRVLAFKED
jgi:SAM-dependent methyltransferase